MYVVPTPPNYTVQGLLTSCMQHTDFKSMPSQVLCLAAAIKFTQQAEQAIEAGKLSSLQVCVLILDSLLCWYAGCGLLAGLQQEYFCCT